MVGGGVEELCWGWGRMGWVGSLLVVGVWGVGRVLGVTEVLLNPAVLANMASQQGLPSGQTETLALPGYA